MTKVDGLVRKAYLQLLVDDRTPSGDSQLLDDLCEHVAFLDDRLFEDTEHDYSWAAEAVRYRTWPLITLDAAIEWIYNHKKCERCGGMGTLDHEIERRGPRRRADGSENWESVACPECTDKGLCAGCLAKLPSFGSCAICGKERA